MLSTSLLGTVLGGEVGECVPTSLWLIPVWGSKYPGGALYRLASRAFGDFFLSCNKLLNLLNTGDGLRKWGVMFMARAFLTPWVTQAPWTSLFPNLIFLVHGTPSYSAKHRMPSILFSSPH